MGWGVELHGGLASFIDCLASLGVVISCPGLLVSLNLLNVLLWNRYLLAFGWYLYDSLLVLHLDHSSLEAFPFSLCDDYIFVNQFVSKTFVDTTYSTSCASFDVLITQDNHIPAALHKEPIGLVEFLVPEE